MADGSTASLEGEAYPEIDLLAQKIVEAVSKFSSCVVAFSGGVDSAVVAKAAFLGLGDRATAITGTGAAVSAKDLVDAKHVAACIGIKHVLLQTNEIDNAAYQANDGRRCFHCKSELFAAIKRWSEKLDPNDPNGSATILSGTNADDLGDYRPGIAAGRDFGVQTPLADLGVGKKAVRSLASYWSIPISDKPASPCLASRIAYGEMVTEPKLRKIERAEAWLEAQGLPDCRVRLHPGNLARIEVHQLGQLLMLNELRERLVEEFRSIGFDYVTLDLAGRETGSLNRSLSTTSRT